MLSNLLFTRIVTATLFIRWETAQLRAMPCTKEATRLRLRHSSRRLSKYRERGSLGIRCFMRGKDFSIAICSFLALNALLGNGLLDWMTTSQTTQKHFRPLHSVRIIH